MSNNRDVDDDVDDDVHDDVDDDDDEQDFAKRGQKTKVSSVESISCALPPLPPQMAASASDKSKCSSKSNNSKADELALQSKPLASEQSISDGGLQEPRELPGSPDSSASPCSPGSPGLDDSTTSHCETAESSSRHLPRATLVEGFLQRDDSVPAAVQAERVVRAPWYKRRSSLAAAFLIGILAAVAIVLAAVLSTEAYENDDSSSNDQPLPPLLFVSSSSPSSNPTPAPLTANPNSTNQHLCATGRLPLCPENTTLSSQAEYELGGAYSNLCLAHTPPLAPCAGYASCHNLPCGAVLHAAACHESYSCIDATSLLLLHEQSCFHSGACNAAHRLQRVGKLSCLGKNSCRESFIVEVGMASCVGEERCRECHNVTIVGHQQCQEDIRVPCPCGRPRCESGNCNSYPGTTCQLDHEGRPRCDFA